MAVLRVEIKILIDTRTFSREVQSVSLSLSPHLSTGNILIPL